MARTPIGSLYRLRMAIQRAAEALGFEVTPWR